MGVSKTSSYTEIQIETASRLKALGHPARIAIVQFLLNQKECICNDIVNELPLAQPTISQHLKELKNAGIIQGTIEGKARCYCINPKVIKDLVSFFNSILSNLHPEDQCC